MFCATFRRSDKTVVEVVFSSRVKETRSDELDCQMVEGEFLPIIISNGQFVMKYNAETKSLEPIAGDPIVIVGD